jgi:hypothetical protein
MEDRGELKMWEIPGINIVNIISLMEKESFEQTKTYIEKVRIPFWLMDTLDNEYRSYLTYFYNDKRIIINNKDK